MVAVIRAKAVRANGSLLVAFTAKFVEILDDNPVLQALPTSASLCTQEKLNVALVFSIFQRSNLIWSDNILLLTLGPFAHIKAPHNIRDEPLKLLHIIG